MKRFAALFLPLLLIGCHKAPRKASGADVLRATHYIEMVAKLDGGACTATAIGPRALLTASHCISGTQYISIDSSSPVKFQKILFDEQDHAIVLFDISRFSDIVPIEQREAELGEHVYFIGNPGSSRNVRRDGVYKKWSEIKGGAEIFFLGSFPGDSGSAVISSEGFIIGIVSAGNKSAETACFPLQFTPSQLAEASK